MTPPDAFASAFFELPMGTFTGTADGLRYVVTRQVMAGGKAHKLVAHQLGGKDYISLNLYQTRNSGLLLKPCEMPARKVTEFVIALRPEDSPQTCISEQKLFTSAQSQLIALNVNRAVPNWIWWQPITGAAKTNPVRRGKIKVLERGPISRKVKS